MYFHKNKYQICFFYKSDQVSNVSKCIFIKKQLANVPKCISIKNHISNAPRYILMKTKYQICRKVSIIIIQLRI